MRTFQIVFGLVYISIAMFLFFTNLNDYCYSVALFASIFWCSLWFRLYVRDPKK